MSMEKFVTPSHLVAELTSLTEDRYLAEVTSKVAQLNKALETCKDGSKITSAAFQSNSWVKAHYGKDKGHSYKDIPQAFSRRTDATLKSARDQVNSNVSLLEERVAQHLVSTDDITECNLRVVGDRIEGYVYGKTAEGESFSVYVRMMWNYRYGSNSANGVVTQYAQFRSERQGARQEGKPVVTVKQAEKDAARAAREEKKAAANEAARARFDKGLVREAKGQRKLAAEARSFPAQDESHKKHLENLACEYEEVAKQLELATCDTPWLVKRTGQQTTFFEHFRTASAAAHNLNR